MSLYDISFPIYWVNIDGVITTYFNLTVNVGSVSITTIFGPSGRGDWWQTSGEDVPFYVDPINGNPPSGRKPPPQPKKKTDPCGNTTDINVGIGNITFGLQIGQHAVYPYAGITLFAPRISASLTSA